MPKKRARKRARRTEPRSPAEIIRDSGVMILELIGTAEEDLGKSVASSLQKLEAPEEVLSALVEAANGLERINGSLESPVLATLSESLVECHDALAPTEGSGLEDGELLPHEQVAEEVTETLSEQLEALLQAATKLVDDMDQQCVQMAEQIDGLIAENDGLREQLEEYQEDDEED